MRLFGFIHREWLRWQIRREMRRHLGHSTPRLGHLCEEWRSRGYGSVY